MVRYNVAQVCQDLLQDTRRVDGILILSVLICTCLPFVVSAADERGKTAATMAQLGCVFVVCRSVALWQMPLYSEHLLLAYGVIWQVPHIWTELGTWLLTQAQKASKELKDAWARRAASAPQPRRPDTKVLPLAAGAPQRVPRGKSPGRGKSPRRAQSPGRRSRS